MYYVYIIKSLKFSNKIYIGYTQDVKSRLEKHNNGGSTFTKKLLPWKLVFHSCFYEKSKALDFEKYLKSHSGRSFIRKRLL